MRATIIITVSLLALLGAAFAVRRHVDRTYAQPSRDPSKMMPALDAMAGQLSRVFLSVSGVAHSPILRLQLLGMSALLLLGGLGS
jgi:hypothetical protein